MQSDINTKLTVQWVYNANAGLSNQYIDLSNIGNGIYLMTSNGLHLSYDIRLVAIVIKYNNTVLYKLLDNHNISITGTGTNPVRLNTNMIPYRTQFLKLGY